MFFLLEPLLSKIFLIFQFVFFCILFACVGLTSSVGCCCWYSNTVSLCAFCVLFMFVFMFMCDFLCRTGKCLMRGLDKLEGSNDGHQAADILVNSSVGDLFAFVSVLFLHLRRLWQCALSLYWKLMQIYH